MKFLKWLVIALVVLITPLVVYLTFFFDINNFKPEIIDAVKKQTGRELVIENDLNWSFFPSVGINTGKIRFSNPEGFSQTNMIEINQIVANVSIMPLLQQQVEVDTLTLDGLVVNLVTNKQGVTSFDGLDQTSSQQGAENSTTPDNTTAAADGTNNLSSLTIGGINLTNIQVNIIDEQADTQSSFTLKSFTLGEFSLDKLADIAYEFEGQSGDINIASNGNGKIKVAKSLQQVNIDGFTINTLVTGDSMPNKRLETSLTTNIDLALDNKTVSVDVPSISALDLTGNASVTVNFANTIPVIDVKAEIGDIDLDAMLPKTPDAQPKDTTETASTNIEAQSEPDLSALKNLDVTVAFKAKSIQVNNLITNNWVLNTTIKQGVVNLSNLSADLYEGKLAVNAQLDARKTTPTYKFEKKITGVQFRPLLTDLAEVDMLAGQGELTIKGQGSSLITDKLKQNLIANGAFNIADGALYGVNVPQMIRSAQLKLKGDLSAQDEQELKTDFTSLTGSFSITGGVVNNPDLAMASPLIRLNGQGSSNFIDQSIDYRLTTSVVSSLEGQGDDQANQLSGVDIPLIIGGTYTKPSYSIDTQALLEGQFKEEADKAKDKLKDSLFKKLGGF